MSIPIEADTGVFREYVRSKDTHELFFEKNIKAGSAKFINISLSFQCAKVLLTIFAKKC